MPDDPNKKGQSGPPMPKSLEHALESIQEKLEQTRIDRIRELAAEGYTSEDLQGLEEEAASGSVKKTNRRAKATGRYAMRSIEEAQLRLFKSESEGRFVGLGINPGAEFPKLLTRLPVFLPVRKGHKEKTDSDNAVSFKTTWGKGRKHGPLLTVYDEDTLMGLMRLRQQQLTGDAKDLPIPVAGWERREPASVHTVFCLVSQLQEACGGSVGGRDFKKRIESVKKLAATRLELDSETAENWVSIGSTISMIDVMWQKYEQNAILYVQFPPAMAGWLTSAYAEIDWTIRRELTYVGKAIHRFLSGRPKKDKILTVRIMDAIGFKRKGGYKEFARDLRACLSKLEELDWIDKWEITGDGKAESKILKIER